MNLADERWETIKDFPNYMISTESRILNKTTLRMVATPMHQHGYRCVRFRKGDAGRLKNGRAILSSDDVKLIRQWYASGFYDELKIGKIFNVTGAYATRVARGKEATNV